MRSDARKREQGTGGIVAGLLALLGLAWLSGRAGGRLRGVAKVFVAIVGAWMAAAVLLMGIVIFALVGGWGHLGDLLSSTTLCFTPAIVLLVVLWLIGRSRGTSGDPGADQVSIVQRLASLRPASREQNRHPNYYRDRAAAYRKRIQKIIKAQRSGPLADAMASVLPRLQRWHQRVAQLADRLQSYEGDRLIRQDVKDVPRNIARLEKQIEVETDPQIQKQMFETLDGYREHEALMAELARVMRRTRLQLDDTLAAMGTVYSQIQMIDAMDIDSPKAARIALDIDEQIQHLNDVLSVMPEAYRPIDEDEELSMMARRIRLQRGDPAHAEGRTPEELHDHRSAKP
jgi:hypothetical protein